MSLIQQHLDKDNLHHAYLIEGASEEVLPEIFLFIKKLGIQTSNNPDFYNISVDSFKIEDARNLKSIQYERGFFSNTDSNTKEKIDNFTNKKIFIISANNFLLEAQNTLLKIFEEPIKNTHFFIILPNIDILLKTLVSRFYLIRTKLDFKKEIVEAEKFISMPLKNRIDFVKELIKEAEEDNLIGGTQSNRSRSLKFLNALESVLASRTVLDTNFKHLFKVREFLNQPGSSIKSLMESVAIIVPNF